MLQPGANKPHGGRAAVGDASRLLCPKRGPWTRIDKSSTGSPSHKDPGGAAVISYRAPISPITYICRLLVLLQVSSRLSPSIKALPDHHPPSIPRPFGPLDNIATLLDIRSTCRTRGLALRPCSMERTISPVETHVSIHRYLFLRTSRARTMLNPANLGTLVQP